MLALFTIVFSVVAEARGGFSSGGGRGGFSGGGRSVSAPSVSRAPSVSAPSRSSTTTTTTRTYRSTYLSSPPVMYGGMGMGYGYSNGMLTGLIIGNMMHPHNTVVYAGPGSHSNNALLYPDGRVVNQHGQQVGTYTGGSFTPLENGPVVAQPLPADVQVEKETSVLTYIVYFILIALVIILLFAFIAILI